MKAKRAATSILVLLLMTPTLVLAASKSNVEASAALREAMNQKVKGMSKDARISAKNCIKLAPGSEIAHKADIFIRTELPRNDVSVEAQRMNNEAYNLLNSGKVPEARALFSKATKLYPNFEWPFSNLGIISMQDGDYGLAKVYFRRAVAINPDYVNAMHNLAVAYYKTDDAVSAEQCLRKILRVIPNEPDAIALLYTIKRNKPGIPFPSAKTRTPSGTLPRTPPGNLPTPTQTRAQRPD